MSPNIAITSKVLINIPKKKIYSHITLTNLRIFKESELVFGVPLKEFLGTSHSRDDNHFSFLALEFFHRSHFDDISRDSQLASQLFSDFLDLNQYEAKKQIQRRIGSGVSICMFNCSIII